MAEISARTRPAAAVTGGAARLSLTTTLAFIVLLVALHLLKPAVDPSWHFISEYAIGELGWMMTLAFFSLALAYIALFFAIRSQVQNLPGWAGSALLLVSAIGLVIAGVFEADPITAAPEALTSQGNLHNLGGTLGLAMPFAAAFISWSLARNPAWSSARRALLWAALLAWLGFLGAFLSLAVMLSQSGGSFGPGVLVGWPNRLEMLAYCIWLMVVSRSAIRLEKHGSPPPLR